VHSPPFYCCTLQCTYSSTFWMLLHSKLLAASSPQLAQQPFQAPTHPNSCTSNTHTAQPSTACLPMHPDTSRNNDLKPMPRSLTHSHPGVAFRSTHQTATTHALKLILPTLTQHHDHVTNRKPGLNNVVFCLTPNSASKHCQLLAQQNMQGPLTTAVCAAAFCTAVRHS
jgi:hypothetical protein